jgi:hypothetical protein
MWERGRRHPGRQEQGSALSGGTKLYAYHEPKAERPEAGRASSGQNAGLSYPELSLFIARLPWTTHSKQAAYLADRTEDSFEKIAAQTGISKHRLMERVVLYNRAELDACLMDR